MALATRTRAFWQERYDKTQAALGRADELLEKVTENPRQEYEFDSGDGRIEVKVWSPAQVNNLIDSLETRLVRYGQRICGGNAVFFRMRR